MKISNTVNTQLAHRIKQTRLSLKLTQAEFAAEIGFRQAQYSGIENGYRAVTHNIILPLANKFNVSADWVYTGEGNVFKDGKKTNHSASALNAADISLKELLRPIVKDLIYEIISTIK